MARIIVAWATEDIAYTNDTEAWGAMEYALSRWEQQKWLHGLAWVGHMQGVNANASKGEAEDLAKLGGLSRGTIDVFSARPAAEAKWVIQQFTEDKVKLIGVDPWTWNRIDASKEAVAAHFGDFSSTRLHVGQKGENSYVVVLRLPATDVFTEQNKVTMGAQTPVGKQKRLPVASGETNGATPIGAKNESEFTSLYVGGQGNWSQVAQRASMVCVMSPIRNPSSLPK
jgi:hypothetical protein